MIPICPSLLVTCIFSSTNSCTLPPQRHTVKTRLQPLHEYVNFGRRLKRAKRGPNFDGTMENQRLLEWCQSTCANHVCARSRDDNTQFFKNSPAADRHTPSPCELCQAGQHVADEESKLSADELRTDQRTQTTNGQNNAQASYFIMNKVVTEIMRLTLL